MLSSEGAGATRALERRGEGAELELARSLHVVAAIHCHGPGEAGAAGSDDGQQQRAEPDQWGLPPSAERRPPTSYAPEICVVEKNDAYLSSLSPSTQNGYLLCLLCWMLFFQCAPPILGLGSSMHSLLESLRNR